MSPEGQSQRGRVDHQGSFLLRDLGPGVWRVEGSLDGGRRQASARIRISPESRQVEVVLRFSEGVSLDGTVFLNRRPLPGAEVTVRAADSSQPRRTRSNHQGAFKFADLPVGSYLLDLSHPDQLVAHHERVELRGSLTLELDLRTSEIRGRVFDKATGQAIAEAVIRIEKGEGEDFGAANAFSAGSDRAGSFELLRVPPGQYRLRVLKQGFAVFEEALDLRSPSPAHRIEVPLESTRGLTLRARLARGQTPSLIHVRALGPSGSVSLTRSVALGPAGLAHLGSLPAGEWTLQVAAPGSAVSTVQARVPGEVVPVDLAPGSRLRVRVPQLEESGLLGHVRVLGSGLQPLLGLGGNGELQAEWRMENGFAVIEGLPSGVWEVRVVAVDGRVWRGSIASSGVGEQSVELL